MHEHTCEDCESEFESVHEKQKFCNHCADDKAMEALAQVEAPEGGWPRNSMMDRL